MGNPMKYIDPWGLTESVPLEGYTFIDVTTVVGAPGPPVGLPGDQGGTGVGTGGSGRSPNQVSPWQLGLEWLTGIGPRQRQFLDGDLMTELLEEHRHIQNVVQETCAGERPAAGKAGYSLSGLSGVPKFLHDYSTLTTGGLVGNLAATYLGSYSLSYSLAGDLVEMEVNNTSSAASGLRPPVLGYTDFWQRNVGSRINSFFSSGPMSATSQRFDFSVACP
jgi:hypothetical protein